jgi:enoyl-CoA hydratase/carnithine racemase
MNLVEYAFEDHLVILTMKRGDKKNALNVELLEDLRDAWTRFKADENAWIAILTGEGNVFCAGADKSFIAQSLDGEDFWNKFLALTSQDPFLSRTVGKPTISAINGPCFGGGVSLALSSDFRIANEEAVFRMPESDFSGVIIDWHSGVPMPIMAQLNAGIPVTAKRAYEVGLLNEIVSADQVLDRAVALARTLLARPPLAIRKNLDIVRTLYAKTDPMEHYTLLDYCTQVGNMLAKTEDWQEAMNAFLYKASPAYKGK